MTPAASILMLCYNRPQFMRRAIESVLGQTFGDFEFIVMDHASKTPEPFNIAKEYAAKDSRMRVFRVDENCGVSAGRNRALAEAHGEFVATIEDDDWWAADKLEKQIALLREHPEVGVTDCAYVYADMDGNLTGKILGGNNQTHPQTRALSSVTEGRRINGSGQCFRRAALNAVGGWRPWFKYADDDDLFFRMQENCALHSLGAPLLYFRLGDNLGDHKLTYPYKYAAMYSAYCRRNGEADIIDESPSLESVLVRGAESGFAPRKAVTKTAKKLLQHKSYSTLRAFLTADKLSGGGSAKFFVKLAYWSLAYNRLGVWFRHANRPQNGTHQSVIPAKAEIQALRVSTILPPVYVISLARAKERRENMRRQLDALGVRYEIVNGVDGATLNPEEYMRRLRPLQFKMTYGREMLKGEIGCFLSHCAVWKRVAESETGCALILEDDAVLPDDLPDIVKRTIECEWHWDAVLLSALPRRADVDVLCDLGNGRRLTRYKRRATTLAAYMIRPAGAKRFLEYCAEIRAPIDQMTSEYWKHGAAFYQVDPPPVGQSGEESQMNYGAAKRHLGWRVVASLIRKRERVKAALYLRANRPQRR